MYGILYPLPYLKRIYMSLNIISCQYYEEIDVRQKLLLLAVV